jgi:flagellin
MSLRVNTNIFSLTAQKNLANHSNQLQGSFARLSSGLRIVSAADDAAGLGMSERMRSEIRSLGMAQRNAQEGISLVQTGEGALSEVADMLIRLRELAMESSNETLDLTNRFSIHLEFVALVDEVQRIADETAYNGIKLFDGSNPVIPIQIGVDLGDVVNISTWTSTSTLGLGTHNVLTAAAASSALGAVDVAVDTISIFRASFGTSHNILSSALRSSATAQESLAGAESRIRDADVASETAHLAKNRILQQAATSVLAQANQQPQIALSLLQG